MCVCVRVSSSSTFLQYCSLTTTISLCFFSIKHEEHDTKLNTDATRVNIRCCTGDWSDHCELVSTCIFFLFFKISSDVEKPVITDIDTDNADEFAVAEYANEIFKNMRKREVINEGPNVKATVVLTGRFTCCEIVVEFFENFSLI